MLLLSNVNVFIFRFVQFCQKRPDKADRDLNVLLVACENALPFQFFDSKSWRNFTSTEGFLVSSASTLVRNRLPALYQIVDKMQTSRLHLAPTVCPIIDGWKAFDGKVIGICYSFITVDSNCQ